MKKTLQSVLSLLLAVILVFGLLSGITVSAAVELPGVPTGYVRASDVVYDNSGDYLKNWGARGETCTFLTTYAQNYYTGNYAYSVLSGKSGSSSSSGYTTSQLYLALEAMVTAKQTRTTTYEGTKAMYCYTDCVNSNSSYISSFYSGIRVSGSWDGSTWNREHTWPNSKGFDAQDNDIMMLRPTSVSENSSRGNKAYGRSQGFYDPNEFSNGDLNLHGDVARLMLYCYVRWDNQNYMWGSAGVMESVDVLLDWIAEDPVDTWEMGRNDVVQSITGARNCFVDYPELAFKLFKREVPAGCTTPSGGAAPAYTVTAAANNSAYGSVSVSGNVITAVPAAGYYVESCTVTRGTATFTINGNTITVTPSTDCAVRVNFARRSSVTVTCYALGTVYSAATVFTGDEYTLPASATAAEGYAFAGWVLAPQQEETAERPQTYTVYTPAADTAFYALYSKTVSGGSGTGEWTLLTDAGALSAGMTVAIASNTSGVTAGNISSSVMGNVTSSFSADYSKITELGEGTVQLTVGGTEGEWTFENGSGNLLGATAVKKLAWGSGTTVWSVSVADGNATIQSGTSSYGRFLYNANSPRFTTYTSAANVSMLLPQLYYLDEGGSQIVYTTAPAAAVCDHTYEKDTEHSVAATCTESGRDVYVCTKCGDTYEETVSPLGHLHEEIPAVMPTCTQPGATAGDRCPRCGEVLCEPVLASPLGHLHEEIPAVMPTCTTPGATAGDICPRCNTVLIAPTESPALGHNYIYTDNHDGETHTVTCGRCDYSATENHTFTEGVCVCGAVESTEPEPLPLTVNHTIDLAEDISVMFAVQKTLVADYDAEQMYLTFSYNHYNGNEPGEEAAGTLLPDGEINRNYWYFTLSGITAVEMGNDVTAQLHLFKDGTEYVVNDSYSVATYAYNQLNREGMDAATKTVCANLLRYGAAAQNFKATRTDALPDAAMTDAQKAYLTDPDTVTFTNNYAVLDDLANASVTWVGKTFQMNTRVELMFVFNLENFTGNREDLHLIVNYTDYTGTAKTCDVPNSKMTRYDPNDDTWYFCADCMRSADMRTVLSVAVYEGETRVSPTMRYSVESYGYNKTGEILNLCKCLLAYSDACAVKFAR